MGIWITFFVIILLAAGGAGFYFMRSKEADEPEPEPVIEFDIADAHPFLRAVVQHYPQFKAIDQASIVGLWKSRSLTIRHETGPYDDLIFFELDSPYSDTLSFILTPQPELIGLYGDPNDFELFFSILQYPAEILDRLLDLDVVIVYKWVEAWLLLDPDFPMACYHKIEHQKQTVKHYGLPQVDHVAVIANMMVHTAGVLEKLEIKG